MSGLQATRMRLDKWLWAARFYKTRAQAMEAINGGHVRLNGQRAKPGAALQIGDQITVRKPSLRFELTVQALSQRRGPANVAQQLYKEHAESIVRRETEQAARKEQARLNPRPKRKPDKRERRKIIRFVNKYDQESS
ncbi:RNA-binding S4 domain-containing protein [Thiohalophilus sp.]|uniref:RNA-binding S4 domain-containing protein n=1 Tax=Thiohalophilus sp. TaxID=3028392 RepID=UPI002ACE377E|nr:S4 domain-containing protein [Thiohalophilus sp.]MDZ7662439.1 S4 domain-containing protein [Thiohalophilus sp.]